MPFKAAASLVRKGGRGTRELSCLAYVNVSRAASQSAQPHKIWPQSWPYSPQKGFLNQVRNPNYRWGKI